METQAPYGDPTHRTGPQPGPEPVASKLKADSSAAANIAALSRTLDRLSRIASKTDERATTLSEMLAENQESDDRRVVRLTKQVAEQANTIQTLMRQESEQAEELKRLRAVRSMDLRGKESDAKNFQDFMDRAQARVDRLDSALLYAIDVLERSVRPYGEPDPFPRLRSAFPAKEGA